MSLCTLVKKKKKKKKKRSENLLHHMRKNLLTDQTAEFDREDEG